MDAIRGKREESRESAQHSNRFSPSVENEQADAGRDGQACLARSNPQARTGQEKMRFRVLSLFFRGTALGGAAGQKLGE